MDFTTDPILQAALEALRAEARGGEEFSPVTPEADEAPEWKDRDPEGVRRSQEESARRWCEERGL